MGAQTEEQAVNFKLELRTESKENQIYINVTRITFRRKGTKKQLRRRAYSTEEGEEGKQRSTAEHL